MTVRDEIARYPRQSRRSVVAVLDEAVDEGRLDESAADELLLEWDVDHFPDQIPQPLREHVLNERASRGPRAMIARLWEDEDEDDDDDD